MLVVPLGREDADAADVEHRGPVGGGQALRVERLPRRPEGADATCQQAQQVAALAVQERSCVEKMDRAAPLLAEPVEGLGGRAWVAASAPDSGSSSGARLASCVSARASGTHWRFPPESSPT